MTNLTDLYDHLAAVEEQIGDMSAEMANERAMFGDSGPGSQLRLNDLREVAAELRRKINSCTDPRINGSRF